MDIANIDAKLSAMVKELAKKDAEARELRMDLEFLENADALNMATDHPGGARHPIDDDDEKELIKARNLMKVAHDRKQAAFAEKERAAERLAKSAAATDMLRSELSKLQEAACWKPGDAYGYVDPVATANEIEGWKKAIADKLEMKALLQRDINKQTAQLTALAKEFRSHESAEKDLFDAQTELKTVQEQIRLAKDEANSLRRILKRKESMVDKLETSNDTVDIKQLEANKRLSASKLQKHREAMRNNDVMIRNQAMRIQKFEDKLELIGEAIRGDGDEAEEAEGEIQRVDAEILADVQREITQMKQTAQRQTNELSSLDTKLEAAEGCLRTVTHQRSVTERKILKATALHKEQTRFISQQAKIASKNAEAMIIDQQKKLEKAEADKEAYKRRSASAQARARRQEEQEAKEKQQKEEEARRQREERAKARSSANRSKPSAKPADKKKEEKASEKPAAKKEEEAAPPTEAATSQEAKEEPGAADSTTAAPATESTSNAESTTAPNETQETAPAAEDQQKPAENTTNGDPEASSAEPATSAPKEESTTAPVENTAQAEPVEGEAQPVASSSEATANPTTSAEAQPHAEVAAQPAEASSNEAKPEAPAETTAASTGAADSQPAQEEKPSEPAA